MKYKATYEVDHGVSHGLGSLYPQDSIEKKTFEAEDALTALTYTLDEGIRMGLDFLPNPTHSKLKLHCKS